MSILIYGCTTLTLTKVMEKNIDSNYTRMLWVGLKRFCRQYPTKQQLYGHLPPIRKTIQLDEADMRDTAGDVKTTPKRYTTVDPITWTNKGMTTSLKNCSVSIQDVALKTYRMRWTIETGGERGSGRSILATRYDDDDDGFCWKRNTHTHTHTYILK